MNQVQAIAERTVRAPVERVRAAVEDYAGTRARMITGHYRDYDVREGGTGPGTVVHWTLQVTAKRSRDCLVAVTEPETGLLVESDRNSTLVSTWTVGGTDGAARVRVVTTWEGAHGVRGFFERTFAPPGLRRIHEELLGNLAAIVEKESE